MPETYAKLTARTTKAPNPYAVNPRKMVAERAHKLSNSASKRPVGDDIDGIGGDGIDGIGGDGVDGRGGTYVKGVATVVMGVKVVNSIVSHLGADVSIADGRRATSPS